MADLLSHVLLVYAGCTIAGWYRPIPNRWIAVAMIGAILPDLNRITILVTNGTLEAILGIPFDVDAVSTLGGALVLAGVGAMVVVDRHRRAFAALFAGALSHLFVDALKAYADGAARMWLYPVTWVRHPTPSLYVSSDPAVLVLVGALAAIVAVIDSQQSLEELLETRIVGLLAAAFEPPEPPANEKRTDDQTDETDGDR